MSAAACLGSTSVMYPEQYDTEGEQAAKALCAGCPMAADCLAGALARNEQFGIWGGLTLAERRRLVRPCKRCGEPLGGAKRGVRYHEVCGILARAEQPGRRPVTRAVA